MRSTPKRAPRSMRMVTPLLRTMRPATNLRSKATRWSPLSMPSNCSGLFWLASSPGTSTEPPRSRTPSEMLKSERKRSGMIQFCRESKPTVNTFSPLASSIVPSCSTKSITPPGVVPESRQGRSSPPTVKTSCALVEHTDSSKRRIGREVAICNDRNSLKRMPVGRYSMVRTGSLIAAEISALRVSEWHTGGCNLFKIMTVATDCYNPVTTYCYNLIYVHWINQEISET